MIRYYKFITLSICLLSIFCFSIINVNADTAKDLFNDSISKTAEGTGHDVIQKDPSLAKLVGRVIQVLLAFVGVIFMVLLIYAGYLWMMARGNEQEVNKAQKIIQMAVIGIVIVIGAYAITTLLGDILAAPETTPE